MKHELRATSYEDYKMNDNFNILNMSRELYWKINDDINSKLLKSEQFTIGTQLMRACLSISLNIREGNTFTDARKLNQFKIAIGSIEETDECLILLKKYYNFDYDSINDKLCHIRNSLLKIISAHSSKIVAHSSIAITKTVSES